MFKNKYIKIFFLILLTYQTKIVSPNNDKFNLGISPKFSNEATYIESNKKLERLKNHLESQIKNIEARLNNKSGAEKVDRALSITLKVLAIVTLSYLMYHFWPTKD